MGPWSKAFTKTLQRVCDAAAFATGQHSAEELNAALEALADLPRRVLATDGRASATRARHIAARVARMEQGLPLEDEHVIHM